MATTRQRRTFILDRDLTHRKGGRPQRSEGGAKGSRGGGEGRREVGEVSGVNRVCRPGFVASDPLKSLLGCGAGGFLVAAVQ